MTETRSLDRFVQAQQTAYSSALAELRAGEKTGHWIWFVFPQIRGLGLSPLSQHYAIQDLQEARAYAAHPVLGPRLLECVAVLRAHAAQASLQPTAVLGPLDATKLRSCLTLFAQLGPPQSEPFEQALQALFGGRADPHTLAILGQATP